jgi:hypothetical protein
MSTLPDEPGQAQPRIIVTNSADIPEVTQLGPPEENEDAGEPGADTKSASPTDDTATEDQGADDGKESEVDDDEAGKKRGVGKRLAELTREREEARRQAAMAQAQVDRALQILERQLGNTAPAEQQSDSNAEPDPANYANGEADIAYLRDMARHEVRQEFAAEQARAEHRRQIAEIQAREQAAIARYPDYQDVVTAVALQPMVQGNPDLLRHIMLHEAGPDIAYQLASDHALQLKLAKMSPFDAGIALQGIINQPPPKVPLKLVPTAPEPITPIRGAGSAPAVSRHQQLEAAIEAGDYDKWRKLRSAKGS